MSKDLVSIITPCYNGAAYVSQTIESVLSQTYPRWEMIVVDDGSKDSSAEIVRSYAEKDPRITLIQQENGGSAAARNNGIRNANGRYLALLDADDLWEPAFLEEQIRFMNEHNAVCVYSSYRCIDENSREILRPVICKPSITTKDMMVTNYIGCLTGLYDMQKYGKIYLREELKSIRDDYAFWLDIVKLEGAAYGNPKLLARYRVLAGSTTGNKKKLIKKQYQFYRGYLKLGVIKSFTNLIHWGLMGLKKYKGL